MITPTLDLEQKLWQTGFTLVCGTDEVGRGSFAGPVMVGAVIFPKGFPGIPGVADSKLLKPKVREKLSKQIKKEALSWAVASISVREINSRGIGEATQMAFRKSIKMLASRPDFILIDAFYNFNEVKIPSSAYIKHLNRKKQRPVKNGDKICTSIAAASIIAKVERDQYMRRLHKKYPQYGFAKHKGYGTKQHQSAIKRYGLSKVHRKSFNLEKFL